MKSTKAMAVVTTLILTSACDDKNDNAESATSPVSLSITPKVSDFKQGRVYFNNHTINTNGDYQLSGKTLSVIDQSNSRIVHQQTHRKINQPFETADLAPGEYTVRLSVAIEQDDQIEKAEYVASSGSPLLENTSNSDEPNPYVQINVDLDFLEFALDENTYPIAACVQDQICKIDTDTPCTEDVVQLSCQMSDACLVFEPAELLDAINQGLSDVSCGSSLNLMNDTPVIIWASGGAGANGGPSAQEEGSRGASGEAVFVTTLNDFSNGMSDSLYYALGYEGTNFLGDGGAPSVVTYDIPSEETDSSILLVAGGGGGGEASSLTDSGQDGYGGGKVVSRATTYASTKPGDGGGRGGGADACTVLEDCGSTNGDHKGGDGMYGRGGKGVDGNHAYWTNIPSEDYSDSATFGYQLYHGEGYGGDAHDPDWPESWVEQQDGAGGGGHGGGSGGDDGYGGGGGGGSYAVASSVRPTYLDLEALELEINDNDYYGRGTLVLIWVVERETE